MREGWLERMRMFADRHDAGKRLGRRLRTDLGTRAGRQDVIVIGLPRGGVIVAGEVATQLGAPLDIVVVRKLAAPTRPELAIGAIGEGGVRVLNNGLAREIGMTGADVRSVEMRERLELERRAHRFRGDRPRTPLGGKTVVVVDDGIATGATARAGCAIARAEGAARVILAVPVAPAGWVDRFRELADDFVALEAPASFGAIGEFYDDFGQTTDDEVIACLAEHRPADLGLDEAVVIDLGAVRLHGHLTVPVGSEGIVVFAHGSGSSRHSPRNVFVAGELEKAGLATLLFDLLTGAEESDRRNVFDIPLLAERLVAVTNWLEGHPRTGGMRVGYFGASTGAAAALSAAADVRTSVDAVVSRGGRPDLAGPRLHLVEAPTLFIVGGNDREVLELNQRAAAMMHCPTRIWVVPEATHLFAEPGALEAVAELAGAWFVDHLVETDRAGTSQP
jgi:putative phosphoribosyl transferase